MPHLLVLLIGCYSMLICELVKLKGCLIRLQFQGYVISWHPHLTPLPHWTSCNRSSFYNFTQLKVHQQLFPLWVTVLCGGGGRQDYHCRLFISLKQYRTNPCVLVALYCAAPTMRGSHFLKTCHWRFWWRSSCQQCARHTVSHSNQNGPSTD